MKRVGEMVLTFTQKNSFITLLHSDWSSGDLSSVRALEFTGAEISADEFVIAAHAILSGNIAFGVRERWVCVCGCVRVRACVCVCARARACSSTRTKST